MRLLQELPGLTGEEAVMRIGAADLCDLWGITPGALTQLVKRGIAVKLGHDAYDLVTSTRAYIESLRGAASGRGGEEQVLTLTGERARLARAQADAQELKNATLRSELVPASEVEAAWSDILRQVRARILSVPSRLRQEIKLSPGDVDAFDRELRAALMELGHDDA